MPRVRSQQTPPSGAMIPRIEGMMSWTMETSRREPRSALEREDGKRRINRTCDDATIVQHLSGRRAPVAAIPARGRVGNALRPGPQEDAIRSRAQCASIDRRPTSSSESIVIEYASRLPCRAISRAKASLDRQKSTTLNRSVRSLRTGM